VRRCKQLEGPDPEPAGERTAHRHASAANHVRRSALQSEPLLHVGSQAPPVTKSAGSLRRPPRAAECACERRSARRV